MRTVYIHSLASISSQKTFDNSQFLDEIVSYDDTVIPAVNPVYKDYIPPAAARRMAKGIKMGIVASKLAMKDANLETVDAIITGTGMGCLRDSEKFVSGIIDNDEQFLTPTPFIQSTHNTVGGQIALDLSCKGYNFTYVHSSNSFESALLDAKMQIELEEENTILIGGVDELADHTVAIHKLINHVKETSENSLEVLKSKTKGALFSEGANFFVLGHDDKKESYAEVAGIEMFNTLSKENLVEAAIQFLKTYNLSADDVDAIVLGRNGDVDFDDYYDVLSESLFKTHCQLAYKHMCGEFNTASSFGVWLAARILKLQHIPDVVKYNAITSKAPSTILLYNQYRGENHSFVLLKKC